jgi:hypothetical protein
VCLAIIDVKGEIFVNEDVGDLMWYELCLWIQVVDNCNPLLTKGKETLLLSFFQVGFNSDGGCNGVIKLICFKCSHVFAFELCVWKEVCVILVAVKDKVMTIRLMACEELVSNLCGVVRSSLGYCHCCYYFQNIYWKTKLVEPSKDIV